MQTAEMLANVMVIINICFLSMKKFLFQKQLNQICNLFGLSES